MCWIKTVIVATVLLLAAGFCMYQVNSEKKKGHHSEIKSEPPCEKEYKKYYLNGGECYYLVYEDIIGCNCPWLYGENRCKKFIWWTQVKYSIRNLTRV